MANLQLQNCHQQRMRSCCCCFLVEADLLVESMMHLATENHWVEGTPNHLRRVMAVGITEKQQDLNICCWHLASAICLLSCCHDQLRELLKPAISRELSIYGESGTPPPHQHQTPDFQPGLQPAMGLPPRSQAPTGAGGRPVAVGARLATLIHVDLRCLESAGLASYPASHSSVLSG